MKICSTHAINWQPIPQCINDNIAADENLLGFFFKLAHVLLSTNRLCDSGVFIQIDQLMAKLFYVAAIGCGSGMARGRQAYRVWFSIVCSYG